MAIITAAPSNSKTMETVVDVGKPIVLKKSNNKISVIITAMKMKMISSKKNAPGLNIPFLATSIIPLEDSAPKRMPTLAKIMIFLNEKTLDPIAEFRKFTASLLTPTIKSPIANRLNRITINKYMLSISLSRY